MSKKDEEAEVIEDIEGNDSAAPAPEVKEGSSAEDVDGESPADLYKTAKSTAQESQSMSTTNETGNGTGTGTGLLSAASVEAANSTPGAVTANSSMGPSDTEGGSHFASSPEKGVSAKTSQSEKSESDFLTSSPEKSATADDDDEDEDDDDALDDGDFEEEEDGDELLEDYSDDENDESRTPSSSTKNSGSSMEDNIKEYKKGGYHPVVLGTLYAGRYRVLCECLLVLS